MRWAILSLLLVLAGAAAADEALTLIPLKHRTAEDLLPSLVPFVEGRGAIAGAGSQIFLRSSPAVAREVRELVASLDVAPRSLWISVRQVFDRRSGSSYMPVRGDQRGGMDVLGHRFHGFEDAVQSLRALEGREAEIAIERDVPIPVGRVSRSAGGAVIADDWYYETFGTGFFVVPRLWQDRASLEIVTRHAPAVGTSQDPLELRTSVDTTLGQWTEIGQVLEEHASRFGGPTRHERTRHSVLVKVELQD